MSEPSVHGPKRSHLGPGGWFVVIALVCILAASVWFAFYGWNLTEGEVSTNGMIALTLGIVFSMLLGGGLMALVFWSNRKGYDR
jgi:TRAP-type C4-dicarboxylate transport system permease small subunit